MCITTSATVRIAAGVIECASQSFMWEVMVALNLVLGFLNYDYLPVNGCILQIYVCCTHKHK